VEYVSVDGKRVGVKVEYVSIDGKGVGVKVEYVSVVGVKDGASATGNGLGVNSAPQPWPTTNSPRAL